MYTKNIVRRDADGGHGHGGHGGGGHAHASAPSSGYDSPSPSYGAPSTGYGAPSSSYNEPSPSYGTPDTGYGAPATGYGGGGSSYDAAPSYGGDDGGLFPFDLSALIIPILAIVGLSLLFPVITTVDVKKRKRRDLSDLERGKSTKMRSFLCRPLHSCIQLSNINQTFKIDHLTQTLHLLTFSSFLF